MFILHSLLWHSVLFLNVYETFKCLKPSRAATKHRPGRTIGDRKRQIKSQLALWIVWILYTWSESFADRTVSYVVPFYSELKMGVLLWMIASRSFGSQFVYANFISPTLFLYSTPLDLLFSLVYELSEATLWLLAFPFNRLRTSLGFSSSTDDDQGGDGAGEETSLTPRTVVRRAKKVYEEIERLQKMERPGMVKSRKASGAGVKKDPRLRERKMVLERQAREKEDRELEEEVEEMARVERDEASAKEGRRGTSSLKVSQSHPNVSRTSSSSTLPSNSTGPSSRPPPTNGSQTVRRGPSASLQPNAVASSSSSSAFTRPTILRPSSNLDPSKAQPIASSSRLPLAEPSSSSNLCSSNAFASSSSSNPKPSHFLLPACTASSSTPPTQLPSNRLPAHSLNPILNAARSSLRPSTPTSQPPAPPTQHASFAPPSTPMPPGAFFHSQSQLQLQQPPPIALPLSQPSQQTATSPPRKRKLAGSEPPKLRATPARKAKSKALLEMHASYHVKEEEEEVVELEERQGDEDGGKKRRRKNGERLESDEEMSEDENGSEGEKKKGKGRDREVEEEEDEEEPKPEPKPTRRRIPTSTSATLPTSKRTATTRNPSLTAPKPSTSNLRKPSVTSTSFASASTTTTRSTRGAGVAASSSWSSSLRAKTSAPLAGRKARVPSGGSEEVLVVEEDEDEDVVVVVRGTGTMRGRGRGRGGKVVG